METCNFCHGEGIINPHNDINTTTLCSHCDGSGKVAKKKKKKKKKITEDTMKVFEEFARMFPSSDGETYDD